MATAAHSLVRGTWRAFQQDSCTMLAAGIAYYALFSFIPLATLLLALLGFLVRDPASRQLALDRILHALPLQSAQGQNLVLDSLRAVASQAGGLSIAGGLGLYWAASGLFGAIRTSLHIVWRVRPSPSFLADRFRDACAVVVVGLLLMVSMAGTLMAHLVPANAAAPVTAPWVLVLAGIFVSAVVSFIGFTLTYWHVPRVRHDFFDVWPGALLAMILFELSKHAFALYASLSAGYRALYGLLGGVMLFMMWTYTASLILLIGAVLTCEYERSRVKGDGGGPLSSPATNPVPHPNASPGRESIA
jgi:membrane protein